MCHFVVEHVFSGAFEEAMRRCACALMEAGYCVLVHVRLCSVQRILPRREYAEMQDEAYMPVSRSSGFGSCSAVYCVEGGGKLHGVNIQLSV